MGEDGGDVSAAESIPELPAADRSAEELIRLVQDCVELVKRRDLQALNAVVGELGRVQDEIRGLSAVSGNQALKVVRGSIRAFIMAYIMGDDIEADPELRAALSQMQPQKVPSSEPIRVPQADPGELKGAGKILEQVSVSTLRAVETAEALTESAYKYKDKCGAEPEPFRRKVYGLLAIASSECAGHHTKVARVWTELGKAILEAKTEGSA